MMSGGMAAMETWGQGSLGDPYAKRITQWPWCVKLHIRVLPQNLTFLYNHIPQHLYLLWHLFPHHTYYIISAKPESRVFDWYSILCLAHIDLTKGATFQKLCRGIVGKRLEEEKKEAMLGGFFHLRCTVPLEPEQFVNIAFGNTPPPPFPYICTHWCSIWKFRCPVTQSLKNDWFTLHVACSWWAEEETERERENCA